jgi:hypothetical protein
MKSFKQLRERCWPGYKPTPGKKAYQKGSCVKEESDLSEDLRKWFDPKHPEGGWKRINSKGEAIGPCAREPGEAKPKCMSNEKRASLSKKERASAVSAKRRHDPNPERKGEPINVSNFGKGKLSEQMDNLEEENKPTNPELWARAKSLAKSKFDVYPSAYANGWAAKWYKSKGGGWRSVNEEIDTPSQAAMTYKEKPNKEPMPKLKEKNLEEGRLSQRHPLEGHEYHKKSDAELVHIAKDAHKASEAMKSHNTQAENKYRDQANDSATVRHFRQKSGMPDWYKKKYGHMKEETDTTEKVEMVQSQLHFIKYACEEILDYIEQGGEVEEWYQVKVAKSFSEFESLHAFIEGESRRTGMKEETEKFPFVAVHAKKGMHQTHGSTSYEAAQNAAKHWKMKSTAGIDVYRADKKHVATESVESLDEISAETKSSYTQKATKEVEQLKTHAQKGEYKDIAKNIITRRQKGLAMAKEEKELEEGMKPYVSSLSPKLSQKGSHDVMDKEGKVVKSYPHNKEGMKAAQDHLKKMKEEKEQGASKKKEEKFHMKLDNLVHKTFGHSPKEKMAKEEVEQIDEVMSEPDYNQSIKARQEKANKEPPFKPDAPKKQSVIPGKHGEAYSRVRHLARQALKKQAEKLKPVKESLDESRKAEIVREVMKKKKNDKDNDESFQKDPVLSSEITKA